MQKKRRLQVLRSWSKTPCHLLTRSALGAGLVSIDVVVVTATLYIRLGGSASAGPKLRISTTAFVAFSARGGTELALRNGDGVEIVREIAALRLEVLALSYTFSRVAEAWSASGLPKPAAEHSDWHMEILMQAITFTSLATRLATNPD